MSLWPHEDQRAENGGLDPSCLIFAFLGRPDFPSRDPETLYKYVFGDLWTENRGAPKMRKAAMTDPTPYSWPSEKMESFVLFETNIPCFIVVFTHFFLANPCGEAGFGLVAFSLALQASRLLWIL